MLKNKTMKKIGFSTRLIIIILFVILVGVSIGTFTEIMLSADAKASIRDYLNYNLVDIEWAEGLLTHMFLKSIAINLGLFLIIMLSGLTVAGFPAALLALLYKGASLGFSSALLMDTLNLKGVLFVLLTLLPPNLIIVPALCGSAILSMRFALTLLSADAFLFKKEFRNRIGSFLIVQMLMAASIIGGCFLESFIFPLLQRQLI